MHILMQTAFPGTSGDIVCFVKITPIARIVSNNLAARIVQVTRPIPDNGFQGMPLARPGDPSQGSDNRIVEEAEWTVEWHKVREVVVGAVRSGDES